MIPLQMLADQYAVLHLQMSVPCGCQAVDILPAELQLVLQDAGHACVLPSGLTKVENSAKLRPCESGSADADLTLDTAACDM